MKQSRRMSLVEAVANVAIGYGIAVATQLVVFPWFGLPARVGDALAIGAIFTAVSIGRSFTLRRLFEAIRMPTSKTLAQTAKPVPAFVTPLAASGAHRACPATSRRACSDRPSLPVDMPPSSA